MKKSLTFYIICMIMCSSCIIISGSQTTLTNELSILYTFNTPTLQKIRVGDEIYDYITVKNSTSFGNPGEPVLPIRGAYILIPKNTKLSSIKVTPSAKISLGSNFKILPGYNPVRVSQPNLDIQPEPNPSIYQSSDIFPSQLFEVINMYKFRGYHILILALFPVQYVPKAGELLYFESLTIKIGLESDKSNDPLDRHRQIDSFVVKQRVDNPIISETYAFTHPYSSSFGNYDLLILTTENLKEHFMPLKEAHLDKGILVEIKTLKDIKPFSTTVTPEDIRNFITQEYLENGIEYVLLGGDVDLIPAKMLWVYGLDENKWPYETNMPSDLYYSCLDGSFNFDGDDKWGEPTDGEDGEDVDLMAEVYVGRACVDNEEDVQNFVTKTITYLNINPSEGYLKKYLFAGEFLGNHGIASWGGNYLDLLINESNMDDYVTRGIPSTDYHILKLYDRDWPDNDWPKQEIIDRINDGIHVINHDGHSSYGYNMKMGNSDIYTFENTNPFFAYSVGCMCGGFDDPNGYDCFAEHLTVKTPNGAFAAIMNARYGWFWSHSTDGDSTRYTREFWDAVFGEKIPVISKANQDSKEDNLYLIGRSCMRWCYYQLNLFGDPTIALHTSKAPVKPEILCEPFQGTPNEEYLFAASSTDPDGDQLYYLYDWGDDSTSGWLGPFTSGNICESTHSWNEKGSYTIRVKAKDIYGVESPWSDPLVVTLPKTQTHILSMLHKLFQSSIRVILNYIRIDTNFYF